VCPEAAAWCAPYAPTLTASAAAGLGGGRLPTAAVTTLRHAVALDNVVWPQRVATADTAGGDDGGDGAGGEGGGGGGGLGPPLSIKSMLNVPVSATADGQTVLGVSICEEQPATGGGTAGPPAPVTTVGRWALRPAEDVFSFAASDAGGGTVMFCTFRPRAASYKVCLLQRPALPGGDPHLINQTSTLMHRMEGSRRGVAPTAAGWWSPDFGGGASPAPEAPPLLAARRFFHGEVGTWGSAAAVTRGDGRVLDMMRLVNLGDGREAAGGGAGGGGGSGGGSGGGGGGGGGGSGCGDDDALPSVYASVVHMEVASPSMFARLRALALSTVGVHPGGLRLCPPAEGRGKRPRPAADASVEAVGGSVAVLVDRRGGGGRGGCGPGRRRLVPIAAAITPAPVGSAAGRVAAACAAAGDGEPPPPLPPPPSPPPAATAATAPVQGRARCRRTRVQVELIADADARARVLRNREAARRSNAKRKARDDAAKAAAAAEAAVVTTAAAAAAASAAAATVASPRP